MGWNKQPMYWQQIHWPNQLNPEDALQVLRHLAADRRNQKIVLELRSGERGLVSFLVGCHKEYMPFVKQVVEGHVEGAFVTRPTRRRQGLPIAFTVRTTTTKRPLRVQHSKQTAKAILASIASIDAPHHAAVQIVLGQRKVALAVPTRTQEQVVASPTARLLDPATGRRIDREKRTAYRVKVASPSFNCVIRVGVQAPTRRQALSIGMNIIAGLRTAESRGAYLHVRRLLQAQRLNVGQTCWFGQTLLNINELLGICGWPLGSDAMPGLDRAHYRLLYADQSVTVTDRVVARSTAPGDKRLLGLSMSDALHHLHVLGPTGVGKSTLLLNLAVHDITAGQGTVVIDPKGDLVQDILARIPKQRYDDVIVLDPADAGELAGLNPLVAVDEHETAEVIADHVLAVFHGLYRDAWGPRTQDILHASLLTLAHRPNASLLMLQPLLTDDAFRHTCTSSIASNRALGAFWWWYESISPAEQQQAIAPVMNKLRAFLLRAPVRGIIGQTAPRFTMADIFTSNKILLVSLAKGAIGSEAAALLGSLVVAQLRQATLMRAKLPPESRKPVSIFIDEFQDYMHLPDDLADVLAQARGLGVAMSLAHQHLDQLSTAMRTAVLANARSRICFQLSPPDAALLAQHSDLLTPQDFMGLGKHEIYASLVANGHVMPFASGKTRPASPIIASRRSMRKLSKARYAQSVADTELELLGTHARTDFTYIGRQYLVNGVGM